MVELRKRFRGGWVALVSAVIGAFAVGGGLHWATGNWRTFWITVGTTLIASGLVTFFVEEAWKRELQADAFRAVFGYLLPAAMRTELDWLFTLKTVGDEILRVAVVDPAVVVICPDGVIATVDFGHRESRMTDDGQTFSMSGTLLPWQPLRVRWWRSSDPDTGQVEE